MASATRPTPIFADRILTQDIRDDRVNSQTYGKATWSGLRQALNASQKFVLTEDAYLRIAEAMRAFPEQLVYNAKFARPPHDTLWLEVESAPRPLGENLARRLGVADTNLAEFNTGYLIHQGTIYSFVGGFEDQIVLQRWITDLNTPPTAAEQREFMTQMGFTPETLDRSFWGRLYDNVPDQLKPRLRQQHRVRLLPSTIPTKPTDWDEFRSDLDMHARIVIATLLAFNQPKSVLNITSKDAQRRLTAKGVQRYFAHNVVTINLGHKNTIRFNYRVPGGEHASPRWHEVMGHYVHNRTARTASCTHGFGLAKDWWVRMDTEDGRERWECSGCGGKRTWRTYPEGRGDASKGMSLHHHVVQG